MSSRIGKWCKDRIGNVALVTIDSDSYGVFGVGVTIDRAGVYLNDDAYIVDPPSPIPDHVRAVWGAFEARAVLEKLRRVARDCIESGDPWKAHPALMELIEAEEPAADEL